MTFHVWESAETRAKAVIAAGRLGRENGDLVFQALKISDVNVPKRERIKAERKGHTYVVGVLEQQTGESVHIEGLSNLADVINKNL